MKSGAARSSRGFTLIELTIATIVTMMVAGTVVGLVEAFTAALAVQDLRSEAIVRSAGAQSHLGLISLKSRMTLALSPQRVLLWLPSETLAESGSGADAAFDRIDLIDDELHWLEFVQEPDESWTLVEWTVRIDAIPAGASVVYFTADGEYWNNLFDYLQAGGVLRRSPLASGISPAMTGGVLADKPRFVWQSDSVCDNRSIGAEFAFVAPSGEEVLRSDVRVESALAFFDRHPICTESGS